MDEYSKRLIESYGIDKAPDFSSLIDVSVSNMSYIPKNGSWDESHMLQNKEKGLDFVSVCVKILTDSRTSYELGLVKVVGWKVVDTFFSFIQPVTPISKALRKKLPEDFLIKVDNAPSLNSIWPDIEHFFESNVLCGSHESRRCLLYCLDKYEIDISPVALPVCPTPKETLVGKSALDCAVAWAASRIRSRL